MNEYKDQSGYVAVVRNWRNGDGMLLSGSVWPGKVVMENPDGTWRVMRGQFFTVEMSGEKLALFCTGVGKPVYRIGEEIDPDDGREIIQTDMLYEGPPTGI